MELGIKNAPAVFQCLIQSVLKGLKTESNPAFVDVYLDDDVIFSTALGQDTRHIHEVIKCFDKVNLN